MSTSFGVGPDEEAVLGADGATRVRTFRLILTLAQRLRTAMDERLRADGLTTQQAALISVVEAMGAPPLSRAAAALGTTHQNLKQVARALERKGFLEVVPDTDDGRVRRLVATERSRAYWAGRSAADQREVAGWFAGLSPEEAETLFALLLRVHDRIA